LDQISERGELEDERRGTFATPLKIRPLSRELLSGVIAASRRKAERYAAGPLKEDDKCECEKTRRESNETRKAEMDAVKQVRTCCLII